MYQIIELIKTFFATIKEYVFWFSNQLNLYTFIWCIINFFCAIIAFYNFFFVLIPIFYHLVSFFIFLDENK
jgi:hypothetical protein